MSIKGVLPVLSKGAGKEKRQNNGRLHFGIMKERTGKEVLPADVN